MAITFLVAVSGFTSVLILGSNPSNTESIPAPGSPVPVSNPMVTADLQLAQADSSDIQERIDETMETLGLDLSEGNASIVIEGNNFQDSANLASSVEVNRDSGIYSNPIGSAGLASGYSIADGNRSNVTEQPIVNRSSGTNSGSSGISGGGSGVSGGSSGVSGGSSGTSGGGSGTNGGGDGGVKGPGTSSIIGTNTSEQPESPEVVPDDSQTILSELRMLQPLPKVHYYWPLDPKILLDVENLRLYQIARITQSVCFRGEKATSEIVRSAVYLSAKVNKTEPSIPCSIGVNFGPWHSWYPGLFPATLPPTYRGNEYKAELALFTSRLNKIKNWVSENNQMYGSSIEVGAILLDVERFEVKKDDPVWNDAIRELLDVTQETVANVFPDARIEWYGRGIRWDLITPYWTQKEKYIDSLSCSFYFLPKAEDTERTFKKTCKLADELGVWPVTPWVALASGYQYGAGVKLHWVPNWPYNPTYAYETGCKLNSLSDPWYKRAEIIVFYPEPFNPEATSWGRHFIEYCKGAAKANESSDE